jgi:signal transduction histidine kinase
MEWLKQLFSTGDFLPHGTCYLWNARLVWLHVLSDSLIALAYLSIPITLVQFVRKRKDLPFNWMFLCFGAFIVACGLTHAMEVVTLWYSAYWASGMVKVVTAAVSVSTAILLVRLVPDALALPSTQELVRVNQALQQSNKELDAFSYSVSHDLRAPLRHIDGFSRILLEDYAPHLPSEVRHHLQRIREATQHMGCLTDELLNLSRVGRQQVAPKPVSLRRLVDEAIKDLKEECAGREIDWRVGELPVAECDPALIRQVFANLIGNAVKFTRTRRPAVIAVGARTNNGEAIIHVRDNGVGFDMKYADKLFGVFQRLHSQEEFEGTGVGLATVQRIVHKHGGRVWAEAQPGGGAAFFFTLPAENLRGPRRQPREIPEAKA